MITNRIAKPHYTVAFLVFLPLISLLLNFLIFQGYPIYAPECVLIVAVLFFTALAAMGLSQLFHPLGYLVAAVAMVAYIESLLSITEFTNLQIRWVLLIYVCMILLLTWLLVRFGPKVQNFLVILFTFVLIGTATSQLFSTPPPYVRNSPELNFANDSSQPPYIHIILDSHIGMNALPADIPQSGVVRKTMTEFFEQWSFRHYPAAYSRYYMTRESLTNLFQFSKKPEKADSLIRQNRLFEILKDRGYRINVYQQSRLDFCQPNEVHVDRCYTYLNSSLSSLYSTKLPLWRKTQLVSGHFLSSNTFFSLVRLTLRSALEIGLSMEVTNLPYIGSDAQYDRIPRLNIRQTLTDLTNDVIANPNGNAYFAHLLLPHKPYFYDELCNVDPNTWLSLPTLKMDNVDKVNKKQRTIHYNRYFSQLRCVYTMLNEMMVKFREANILDQAEIVLHGDHGSRLGSTPSARYKNNALWDQILRDGYSTLFAIHSPKLVPGSEPFSKSIDQLLMEFLMSPDLLSNSKADPEFLTLPLDIDSKTGAFLRYYFLPGLFDTPKNRKQN